MASRDAPLSVHVPTPADERPAWRQTGLIAALGFVVGIAWPLLAGTKLAPSPPNDGPSPAAIEAAAAAASSAAAAGSKAAPSASGLPIAPQANAAPPSKTEQVVVGPGTIARCRDAKGRAKDDCGTLPIDPLALPRIQALASCPAAQGASGKLSLGLDIDFKRGVVGLSKGKSTTLAKGAADGVVKCATRAFTDVKLDNVDHALPRYTVFYAVQLVPPGGTADAAAPDAGPAVGSTTNEVATSGEATATRTGILVRDAPKGGKVVARLTRGDKVTLVGKQRDWFHVKVGGSQDGWVHRSGLGL